MILICRHFSHMIMAIKRKQLKQFNQHHHHRCHQFHLVNLVKFHLVNLVMALPRAIPLSHRTECQEGCHQECLEVCHQFRHVVRLHIRQWVDWTHDILKNEKSLIILINHQNTKETQIEDQIQNEHE